MNILNVPCIYLETQIWRCGPLKISSLYLQVNILNISCIYLGPKSEDVAPSKYLVFISRSYHSTVSQIYLILLLRWPLKIFPLIWSGDVNKLSCFNFPKIILRASLEIYCYPKSWKNLKNVLPGTSSARIICSNRRKYPCSIQAICERWIT